MDQDGGETFKKVYTAEPEAGDALLTINPQANQSSCYGTVEDDDGLSASERKVMNQFQNLKRLESERSNDEEEILEMLPMHNAHDDLHVDRTSPTTPQSSRSSNDSDDAAADDDDDDGGDADDGGSSCTTEDDDNNDDDGGSSDNVDDDDDVHSSYRDDVPQASFVNRRSLSDRNIAPPDYNTVNAPQLAVYRPASSAEPVGLESVELHEMGQQRPPSGNADVEAVPPEWEPEVCEGWGRLNFVGTFLLRLRQQLSKTRLVLLTLGLILLCSFVVFVGVFPSSFVFVEYYEIALKKSRLTGRVNREEVLYPGCYILTPDVELVRFQSTAQNIETKTDVFTRNKIIIDIEFTLQYFLKAPEIGQLHAKFDINYHSFIERVVVSTFKNTATQYDIDDYRLNRDELESHFHNIIRGRLNGDCCPDCCPGNCKNNTVCKMCNFRHSCLPSYHVDVRYFQLGRIGIPAEVFERFTRNTILQIEAEREFFLQQHAVEVKLTERESQRILNEAQQILANATANAEATKVTTEAENEKVRTKTYATVLNDLYHRLNITKQDRKLSLFMMRTFEDIKDNVYAYNYDKVTSRQP